MKTLEINNGKSSLIIRDVQDNETIEVEVTSCYHTQVLNRKDSIQIITHLMEKFEITANEMNEFVVL